MKKALIGYTGFVGGNINKQSTFEELYNSTNIQDIEGRNFDLIVCAGAPGVKWLANKEPEKDKAYIQNLISHFKRVKTKRFVLISTVDVYKSPLSVDENTMINSSDLAPYGKHRFELEEFVRTSFATHTIIRLPALFGAGLKKNFIFDLIHNKNLELTNRESSFQFYDMNHLWRDIEIALNHNLSLVNFATQPIQAGHVYNYIIQKEMQISSKAPIVHYDIKTIHAKAYSAHTNYLYSKDAMLRALKKFVLTEQKNIHETSYI